MKKQFFILLFLLPVLVEAQYVVRGDTLFSTDNETGLERVVLVKPKPVLHAFDTTSMLSCYPKASTLAALYQPIGNYLIQNDVITLSGDVSGSGRSAITTTIGSGKVTNQMLAGSIAFSKFVGSDIVLTESQITNLVNDLSAKAPSASPTFTGTVGGITPASGRPR
jgi:hypothetical protein